MSHRPFARALLASAALASMLALGGCNIEGADSPSARSLKPLSEKTLAEIQQKNMTKESPILVRIFKEEAELEVWKQTKGGDYALLKTYPICRWSGELGPKIKEGDRQAPEGFYTITPGQMNPKSNYYLAFNTGFPNAYDRAWGRTGSELMVHGDCSSRGCYAMTDEQIAEIYALARESFFGGQKAFQLQAFPFRMTATNMARHRNSPHLAFWKMIKQGYDAFEVSHEEPKVNVCEKKYVFNAAPAANASTPLQFKPTEACPTYEVDPKIAQALAKKTLEDDKQATALAATTPTAPIKTGRDGGMNPVFLSAFAPQGEGSNVGTYVGSTSSMPGTVPAHAEPPGARQAAQQAIAEQAEAEKAARTTASTTAVAAAKPATAPVETAQPTVRAPQTRVASAEASASSGSGMFGSLTRFIGLGKSETSAAADAKPALRPAATKTASTEDPKPTTTTNSKPVAPTPAPKPQVASTTTPAPAVPAPPAPMVSPARVPTMAGAQPVVPSSSFDTRFGGFR